MVAATDSNLTEKLDIDTEKWHDVEGVQVRYFRMKDSWTKKIPIDYFRKSNADYRTPDLDTWLESCGIQFDVIHSQLPFIYSNRVCSQFASKNRIPYVYSQHGVFDPVRLSRRSLKKQIYMRLFELPICKRSQALIALTEYEKETYRELGLTNRIEVIPNGIDLPEIAHRIEAISPLVLFMARLHPIKGADIAIKAFLTASERFPNARFVMAGPDEFDMVASLAEQIGSNRSIELCGPVTGAEKDKLLQQADIFVLPTESEGFSIALLEAMAYGCAIITTSGAHFDEIETNQAGRIVPRTTDAFAVSLIEMLANPESTREMGNNARKLVERDYTWDKIVDRYEELYIDLIRKER
jgi:glycosyltransferase involved in cell wall biosynthesis